MKKEVFTPKSMKVFGGPVAEVAIAGVLPLSQVRLLWIPKQERSSMELFRKKQGELSAI